MIGISELIASIKTENSKTPLSYQMTEFDCGQTTFLNALRYMFKRNEILPSVIKQVMQYTLDFNNKKGELGKGGTSIYAMEFLVNWINEVTVNGKMKINATLLKGDEANIDNDELKHCIDNGGCAILRVWMVEEHYVLCTKVDQDSVYVFDPYYLESSTQNVDRDWTIIDNNLFEYNRKILKKRMRQFNKKMFSLVDGDNREIILLSRGS